MSSPPRGRVARILLPEPARDFASRRFWKIFLRSLHVLGVCGLFGAVLAPAADPHRLGWLGAVGTGVALLLLDLHESAAFLLQVRGLVVVVKLGVLGLLPHFGEAQIWVLGALVVLSVLSSHAPSAIRYRVLWRGDRIRGGESKG